MNNRARGFTLMELMITLAIVGIVSVVSINIYSNRVRQGRRVDAVNVLLSISLAQERYRANNTTYGTLAQVWGGVSTSPEGFYTLAISSPTATGYTVTATGIGNQASDSESGTACSTLTLTVQSGTVTKTPAVCWPT